MDRQTAQEAEAEDAVGDDHDGHSTKTLPTKKKKKKRWWWWWWCGKTTTKTKTKTDEAIGRG